VVYVFLKCHRCGHVHCIEEAPLTHVDLAFLNPADIALSRSPGIALAVSATIGVEAPRIAAVCK